jgi:ribosomal protein S5
VLTKAMGSTNPINLAMATMQALATLRDPEQELERRRSAQAAPARR